jgi:hypothetical protein
LSLTRLVYTSTYRPGGGRKTVRAGRVIADGGALVAADLYCPAGMTTSLDLGLDVSALALLWLWAGQSMGLVTNDSGSNEVQRLTITGAATGGYYEVIYGGDVAQINEGDSAATIQATLESLSTLAPGEVSCSGGPIAVGVPVDVEFVGPLAGTNLAQMTLGLQALTPAGVGGVTTITDGGPGTGDSDAIDLLAGRGLVWWPGCGHACPLDYDVTAVHLTNATGTPAMFRLRANLTI